MSRRLHRGPVALFLVVGLVGCAPPRIRIEHLRPPNLVLPEAATIAVDAVADDRKLDGDQVFDAVAEGMFGGFAQKLNKWAAIPVMRAELEQALQRAGRAASDPAAASYTLVAKPLKWSFQMRKSFFEGPGRLDVRLELRPTGAPDAKPVWAETYWARHDGEELAVMRTDARHIARMFVEELYPTRITELVEMDDSDPAVRDGVELCKRGRFDAAFEAFFAAVRANPGSAAALYNLAVLQEARGNHDEAERLLVEAGRLAPHERIDLALSRVRRAREDAKGFPPAPAGQ